MHLFNLKPDLRSRFASVGMKLGDPFSKGAKSHSTCHGSGSLLATPKGYIVNRTGCKTTLLFFLRTQNIESQPGRVEASTKDDGRSTGVEDAQAVSDC